MASVAQAVRLTVYLSEDDRVAGHPLHEVLLDEARHLGAAGATVWRGVEGLGASGKLRTTRLPDLAHGLPLVIELVDSAERLEPFVRRIAELAPGTLVVREEVRMQR